MTARNLSFSIDEKSLLANWTDEWLSLTGVKDCLVERPVMLSVKVRLSQLTVILISIRKSEPRILSLTSAIKNVKRNILRNEGIEIDNDNLQKLFTEPPLTVLGFITEGGMKFVLTKLA